LNGLRVCESQLERPLKGLSPLCTEATVSAKTVYWKAADDDSDVQLNQCEELEKNCDWVSENCVKDAEGELSGNCYVYEEVYDCGKDTDSQQALMQTKYSCDGDIRCVGDDCVSSEYDISTSFGKVSALLNAAEMMGQDLQCIGVDANGSPVGDVDVNCFVFSGTHRTCHNSMKGMGGLEVNCCESHAGISLSEYVSLVMMLPKIDTAIMSMESGSMIRGAYNTLRQPVADGLNAVGKYLSDLTKPFTSWVENVTGMDGLFSDSSTSIMDSITGKIKEKATEMVKKMLVSSSENSTAEAAVGGTTGEGTDQIADAASKQAAEMVEGISTALSVIGYIYAAYQITCMLSQMIFACEDDELTLAAQRKMKNCTYVGQYCSKKVLKTCIQKAYSYCCFTSPLGRIINEQVKDQLGQPFRTMDPKHPNCMGISIAEIEAIDWDRIDLGEWTSILIETDNYKELQNMTLDSLTGSGSLLNIDYSTDPNTEITRSERANTLERTINRLDKINLESEKIKTDNSTEVDVTGKKSE